mmetsp:Transcript_9040/g.21220  ORF Transcript_9040/g.21220 Transcript_9040/m.21220 type:complete len:110 (-) Transcript_9040:252-581(-)
MYPAQQPATSSCTSSAARTSLTSMRRMCRTTHHHAPYVLHTLQEAKKAHEAAKKLDDKIEKRKNIAARQAEMRGGTVPNAHKAQKHRKRKAAEKKADAKAKKQKGHKEL